MSILIQNFPRFCEESNAKKFKKIWSMFVPHPPTNIHLLTRESSLIPYSSILEPERSQYNCPATCVVAQQYSPVNFISLRFHSHKANSKRLCYFLSLKLRSLKLHKFWDGLLSENRVGSGYLGLWKRLER